MRTTPGLSRFLRHRLAPAVAVGLVMLSPSRAPAAVCGYVTSAVDETVTVVDVEGRRALIDVPLPGEPTAVTVANDPVLGAAAVVAYREIDGLSVFGLRAAGTTRTIALPSPADQVVAAASGARSLVIALHRDAAELSIVDLSTDAVTTLPLGGRPIGVAAASDPPRAFVVEDSAPELIVIDLASNTIAGRYLSPAGPVAVALNPVDGLVYIAAGRIAKLDPNDGDPKFVISLPGSRPEGIGVTADASAVLVGMTEPAGGTLRLIATDLPDTMPEVPFIVLGVGVVPHAIGIDPRGGPVLVVDQMNSRLLVVDLDRGVIDSIAVAPSPNGIAIAELAGGDCDPYGAPTPTPTPGTDGPCAADCDGDGRVTVNEIIAGVNIALGSSSLSTCPAGDPGGDGEVAINDLIAAVGAALGGCPAQS